MLDPNAKYNALSAFWLSRHSDHRGMSRHVLHHHRSGSDETERFSDREIHALDRGQVVAYGQGRETEIAPKVYPYQIAFNLFPHIDVWMEDGSCKEEWKMVRETRKIMHLSDTRMAFTTVRVPAFYAHSEAVHIELTNPMSPAEARDILSQAPGVTVDDDVARNRYPMPLYASGKDEVFVGRVRKTDAFDNGLSLWVVADNIRKGAALNAVQIAELLAVRGLL